MAKRNLTAHQKKIVDRYYQHRDTIAANKLGELVSELYLADDERTAARLWKQAATAMKNLSVAPAEIDRIVAARDVKALAHHAGA